MFWDILRKDLKRKKTINIVILLFIILAAMFVASGLNNVLTVVNGTDYYLNHNPWKRRLRHWDHAAIYWHIAGSFSPVTLIALRDEGLWGWGLFCFVWLCAVAGTIISFRKMKEHSYVETVCYILMGLSVLVVFKQLFAIAPVSCYWIIGEGVCYIGGAALYSIRSVRYMHSAFHFFVLAGSGCHLVAVWHILAGI